MTTPARTRVLGGATRAGPAPVATWVPWVPWAPQWRALFAAALAKEIDGRRLFLWIPVAAMGGVALNMAADREPALWLPALLTAACAGLAWLCRARALALGIWVALAALCAGFLSMGLRTARVATPVLDHVRTVRLRGFVEEVDMRGAGARFVLRVVNVANMPVALAPHRVRVTMRTTPAFAAGDFIALGARLWPPPRAVLPGGYDFSRDAYFEGIGAVGTVLGGVTPLSPPHTAPLRARFFAAIDRARNRLAVRVNTIISGDEGAIAAAMVTGKRDFLSPNALDLIREAGIFHIITISGLQMTLVAGIFFLVVRRLLALSATLALDYPIKKWAAGVAMLGSLLYDLGTGSRVGTERALIMTLIVLGAVILDRRALSMRNLALAMLAIVALEPDAILGVSFQLSFAAVAALIAVMEARLAALERASDPWPSSRDRATRRDTLVGHFLGKPLRLLLAAFCATCATASFMAYHFHDLSPYVLVGNPLTLAVIECFAVPGALLGTALYPLGLDAPVWLYVGLGIKFILYVARFIAAAPGSTLHVRAFAPSALFFLGLAVLSIVLWRSWLFRASAVPLAALGLIGALAGPRYDAIVAPSGDLAAVRGADGRLAIVGAHFNVFTATQWLAADGDDRDPLTARDPRARCDRDGCVAALPQGAALRIVTQPPGFVDACARAAVVVSALAAPTDCASQVFDRGRLALTGAVGLIWDGAHFLVSGDRSPLEDRPWSPLPEGAPAERVIPPPSLQTPGADPADP